MSEYHSEIYITHMFQIKKPKLTNLGVYNCCDLQDLRTARIDPSRQVSMALAREGSNDFI